MTSEAPKGADRHHLTPTCARMDFSRKSVAVVGTETSPRRCAPCPCRPRPPRARLAAPPNPPPGPPPVPSAAPQHSRPRWTTHPPTLAVWTALQFLPGACVAHRSPALRAHRGQARGLPPAGLPHQMEEEGAQGRNSQDLPPSGSLAGGSEGVSEGKASPYRAGRSWEPCPATLAVGRSVGRIGPEGAADAFRGPRSWVCAHPSPVAAWWPLGGALEGSRSSAFRRRAREPGIRSGGSSPRRSPRLIDVQRTQHRRRGHNSQHGRRVPFLRGFVSTSAA